MSGIEKIGKVLGCYAIVVSLLYSGNAIANRQVQEVAMRVLTSSPATGALVGLLVGGAVGATYGYFKVGTNISGKSNLKPSAAAFICGIIGATGVAFSSSLLLTSYRHISVQIV